MRGKSKYDKSEYINLIILIVLFIIINHKKCKSSPTSLYLVRFCIAVTAKKEDSKE